VTVLRQGKVVGNLVTAETNPAEITKLMIGRDVLPSVHKDTPRLGDPITIVRDARCLSDNGVEALRGVSFEVRAGEIFGIAGVEGNGQTELVEVLTGLRPVTSGQIVLYYDEGKVARIDNRSPKMVRGLRVGYIPEDRRDRGLILPFSIADNLIFGAQDNPPFSRLGVLDPRRIWANARELIPRFDIRPRRADVAAGTLSGGNQQKVVLAREFSQDPRFLIAAQPTRGLDVGAIEFVHRSLVEKRDQGVAILLVSAELDEIMELADRIAVIYEGQIMATFAAGAVDEDRLGLLMTGGEEKTAEHAIDLEAPALETT
jgi:simple sugar transport system ATP-binding protein